MMMGRVEVEIGVRVRCRGCVWMMIGQCHGRRVVMLCQQRGRKRRRRNIIVIVIHIRIAVAEACARRRRERRSMPVQ